MHTFSNLIPTENLINPLNFIAFPTLQNLSTNKSYVPLVCCVLEHILCNTQLSNLEKLIYILTDSLSLIRHNKGHGRNITLSAKQWAKKLDCSVAEIFSMQQSLEEKGYFEISRGRNKSGKNMKNVIIPTLPDSVFKLLANTPNKFDIDKFSVSNLTSSTYIPSLEGKRAYLDRTKMFIKLNYDLLSLVASYQHLAKYSKVMWLGLYATGYRYYLKHRDCDKNATDINEIDILGAVDASDGTNYYGSYSLTTTYQELQDKYSCSKSVISKTLQELETLGFITRQRFFVKNDDEQDNLHDKSIWRITVTLPHAMQQQLMEVKDRAQPAEGRVISNSDPYVSNSSQYINKYFKANKNLDSIDAKLNSCDKPLSELSGSYNNSIQEKEGRDLILQQTNTIDSVSINKPVPKNRTQNKSAKVNKVGRSTTTIVKKSTQPIQVKAKTARVNDNSALDPTNNKAQFKTNQTELTNTVKFSPKATLKDWYPLSSADVDKLNSKSGREFSNNFMNQLLLKLHRKYPARIFPTKNHMLSYMAKALQQELHQAPLVNHETFRFAINDQEAIEQRQTEKYLAEVEYSTDTSYNSQLRRKIAALFESKVAYQLLTGAKFTTTVQEQRSSNNSFDDQYLDTQPVATIQEKATLADTLRNQQSDTIQIIQDHSFTVKLNQEIQLSELQRQTLENAITSVYGRVNITYQQLQNYHGQSGKLQKRLQYEIYLEELDPNSAWYKIRTQLKDQFGSDVDKSWFSKLTAEENLQNKTLILFASSNFMRDWIKNKYGHVIAQFTQELGYQFVELVTKEQLLSHIA